MSTDQSSLIETFVSDNSLDFPLHVFHVRFGFDIVVPEIRSQTSHVPRTHAARCENIQSELQFLNLCFFLFYGDIRFYSY